MLWIYAGTKQAIESKRKAFIRKWRLQCRAVASIVRGAPPSVLELVKLEAENLRYGEDLWAGRGTLRFFPSEIEEHLPIAPLEVLGAFHFSSGYTFPGGEVLHRWV
jgi:Acetoacetate decarboxylase (ADC)